MNSIVSSNLSIVGMLAGGVGIFLLAVGMITDGLKLAAGSSLRALLSRWTRSPIHGIATGFTITAVVQSSSAITVATIGFVNAGILTLNQALGIVFGANIGTTITGWLVAVIGFEINVSALALPLIGIGMVLRLTGGNTRRGAFGTALAGFGLFFIGIQVLKDAFEGLVVTMDVQRYTLEGISGLLFCLAIGFVMTVLTQSSSAAIAIILTAATGGLLGIYAAGAMVIGANVGTTSTAVLSVIGATANAKRVAAAHVVFNVVTAVIALLLLPLVFIIVNTITGLLNIEPVPSVTLALFHTLFNVLGVVVMLPFVNKLSSQLQMRFTSQEEELGRPRFLDKNITATPSLALNAAVLELSHLAEITGFLCLNVLQMQHRTDRRFTAQHDAVVGLALAIGDFVMQTQRSAISIEVAEALPRILNTSQYYLSAAELAVEIKTQFVQIGELPDPEMRSAQKAFQQEVMAFLQAANVRETGHSSEELEEGAVKLGQQYETLKQTNLKRSVATGLAVAKMSELLEQNSNIRRMALQFRKGSAHLFELSGSFDQELQQQRQQDVLHDEVI